MDSADLPAGGEAVVVDPGRNQTVINQCRVQATRDWRSDIPGTQATLFQTITNGVEGMTNASTAPGPGGNPCNSFGDCQTIEDGAPVRRTFAPASMSVILLNYTGSDWSALGRMAYSVSRLKRKSSRLTRMTYSDSLLSFVLLSYTASKAHPGTAHLPRKRSMRFKE